MIRKDNRFRVEAQGFSLDWLPDTPFLLDNFSLDLFFGGCYDIDLGGTYFRFYQI